MRRRFALVLLALLAAGCSSEEKTGEGARHDVSFTIKNAAPTARIVWIELFKPKDGTTDLTAAPEKVKEFDTIDAGDSKTKIAAVYVNGFWRVIGATAEKGDRRVVFRSEFVRDRSATSETVVVDR